MLTDQSEESKEKERVMIQRFGWILLFGLFCLAMGSAAGIIVYKAIGG